jgi:hypothetical protein
MFPGMMPWPTTPKWPPPPDEPAKPLGDPKKPVACVQRPSDGSFVPTMWCGRFAEPNEFFVTDARHVLKHYADVRGNGLRACAECVRNIRAADAKGNLR